MSPSPILVLVTALLLMGCSETRSPQECRDACEAIHLTPAGLEKRFGTSVLPRRFHFAKVHDFEGLAIFKVCAERAAAGDPTTDPSSCTEKRVLECARSCTSTLLD